MKIKKYKYHKLSLMCLEEAGRFSFEYWLQKNVITSVADTNPQINTMLDSNSLLPSMFIYIRTKDIDKWKSIMSATMLGITGARWDMFSSALAQLRQYRDTETLPKTIVILTNK